MCSDVTVCASLCRNDVRAYWLWLRKEVELKSDWVRRLAATATPPPHPPSRCNDPAPSRGNADEYEMSSVQSVHDIGGCSLVPACVV